MNNEEFDSKIYEIVRKAVYENTESEIIIKSLINAITSLKISKES
jgi:hypothetical protein